MGLYMPTAFWGGSEPNPLDPTDIPGLAGWYDASDTTSYRKSGTTIIGINSQGTYGDALDIQGGSNPTAGTTQNSLDTLYFDGSCNFVNPNTDNLVSSTGTHFAVGVFYPQNVNDDKDSLWSVNSTYDYAVSAAMTSAWTGELDLGNGVGNSGTIGPHSSTNYENNWIIVSAMFTKIGYSSNYILFAVNSTYGSNWNTLYNTNLSQSQKLRIMANRNGNKKQPGRFGELLLVAGDRGITGDVDQYVEQAEGYLAHKWGLTSVLPSNHPYKTTQPTRSA